MSGVQFPPRRPHRLLHFLNEKRDSVRHRSLMGLLSFCLAISALLTFTPSCSLPAVEMPATQTASPTTATIALQTPVVTPTPAAPILSSTPMPRAKYHWPEQAAALLPSRADDLVRLDHPSRYTIGITVWPDQNRLAGHMEVQYTNRESVPLNELPFRLYPNLPGYGGELTVQTVSLDGQPIEPRYMLEDTAMIVRLTPPLPVGQSTHISIDYSAEIPFSANAGYRAFINREGILALAGFYPTIPTYDHRGWNLDLPPAYGDPLYADVSLFRVTLTVPRSMIVVSTGVAADQSIDKRAHTRTLTLVSGPAREFNLVMSPNFQTASKQVDDTTLRSYFRPEDRTAGMGALRTAAASFDAFNEMFGLYPYTELDLVETGTNAGGIEYPGLVVLNQNLYDAEASRRLDWVVAHEVAHQWWYGLVGNDQVNEPWIDEALTNYSAWLYFERTVDEQLAEEIFNEAFTAPADAARRQGQDLPIGLPVSEYTPAQYGPIVYSKGPLFFHALRRHVGDETFFSILQTYFARFKYEIATGADFLSIATEVSGERLDELYSEWVIAH